KGLAFVCTGVLLFNLGFIKHFNLEIVNSVVRVILKAAIPAAGFSGKTRNHVSRDCLCPLLSKGNGLAAENPRTFQSGYPKDFNTFGLTTAGGWAPSSHY
ncbi:MAG: hypothetical protein ACYSO2_07025, partial [Planctomycetota bacterium]